MDEAYKKNSEPWIPTGYLNTLKETMLIFLGVIMTVR